MGSIGTTVNYYRQAELVMNVNIVFEYELAFITKQRVMRT